MTIDWWTLGIQTVNIVILVWLLQRFFWRPVAGMIEQRRATGQQMLVEAEAKRGQAAAGLAEIEKTRAGFAKEREAILAAARATADKERTTALADAAKEAAALEATAKLAIAKEQDAAEKAWGERSSHLAIDIAQRLVARLDGAAVRAAFLDWLLKEIRAMPEPARKAIVADGDTLEAISATALSPADQERTRKLISEALGAAPELIFPQLIFKVDAALIAGLELRGQHLVVGNSWRADLARIRTDVTHAGQR